jgi:pimeloyl-ACP methyl ester carboxylesterase
MDIEVCDSLVPVPEGSLFVRRWSAADRAAPPIVLLHDSLGSVEQWRDFPQALAETTGADVIAYDRLGFGRSTPRHEPPSANFIREEATLFFPALQRTLGLGRCVLFGHSVGGAMALVIAGTHPSVCAAVITEAAQAFIEERTLAGVRAARAQFQAPTEFARITRWHGEKARWVLDAWTEVWLSPQFRRWSLDEDLARVSCPVLAIHGDTDQYGSVAFPRRITDTVQGVAELAVLDHCGHVPHREKTAEVLRLTTSFLGRNARDPHLSAAGAAEDRGNR